MNKSVYSGGGMTGLTLSQAGDWRDLFDRELCKASNNKIEHYSPMRWEKHSWVDPHPDKLIAVNPEEAAILGSQRGLSCRDRFDVLNCAAIFVNLWGATRISQGTLIEVGMAAACHHKPIVLLMEENNIHTTPMLKEYAEVWIKPPSIDRINPDEFHNCFEHWITTAAHVVTAILCPELKLK